MTMTWINYVRKLSFAAAPSLRVASCALAALSPLAAAVPQQPYQPSKVSGSCYGWKTKFHGSTSNPSIRTLGSDHYYIGDFDGDGLDEVLTVNETSSGSEMSVMRYNSGIWTKPWHLEGDPQDGGIYDYRANLVVGDFDGDQKDEVLGIGPGTTNVWMTMFHFEGDNWVWGWSNGGDESAGGGIYLYRNYLTAGHFIGSDDRDLLLGGGGWVTLFRFDGTDFNWTWSSGPDDPMQPYAFSECYAGDLDADGQDDVIYVSSDGGPLTWATSFYWGWTGTKWKYIWGWSNGTTSGTIGDWPYPIGSDRLLIGNIDWDSSDEMLFLQRTENAQCAMAMQFPVGAGYLPPVHGWDNDDCYCPFLGTWKLAGGGGTFTDYFLMRTKLTGPLSLLARREHPNNGYYAISVLDSIGAK